MAALDREHAPSRVIELTGEQAIVLTGILRLVTGNAVGRFPLPGTHDGAILEGILAMLEFD